MRERQTKTATANRGSDYAGLIRRHAKDGLKYLDAISRKIYQECSQLHAEYPSVIYLQEQSQAFPLALANHLLAHTMPPKAAWVGIYVAEAIFSLSC